MKDSPTEDFIIDQTLGRDVKFTLDDFPGKGKITCIQLLSSDGTVLESSTGTIGSTWSKTIKHLEVKDINICLFVLANRVKTGHLHVFIESYCFFPRLDLTNTSF